MDLQVIKLSAIVLFLVTETSLTQNDTVPAVSKKTADFMAINSRDLQTDEKSEWIISMRSKLPIASRAVGPFGLAQDRDAKVVRKVVIKPKTDAFAKAVKSIKINAILAKEGKFIIGAREFAKGDVFPMIQGPHKFKIKIRDVRANFITFENLDSKEVVRKILMLFLAVLAVTLVSVLCLASSL